MLTLWSSIALVLSIVSAAPVADSGQLARRAPVALSSAQITEFTPYTYFAAAGYCKPATTKTWTCGRNCDALAGFVTTASGGNGGDTPYWFVGYYPPLNSVVVSFQGTNSTDIGSLIVDADYFLDPLSKSFYPGVSRSVQVHGGFGDAYERSATSVLAAVTTTLTAHPDATVITTGHSLGGALAQLSAVHLKLALSPAGTAVKLVTYSTPRVGNPAWATLVDTLVADVAHVNNKKDVVPIVPGRFLGFAHPSGEVHINSKGQWLRCTGQDSTEVGCTIDAVPNIFAGNTDDHAGPFNGIDISSHTCGA
ncbi:lipase [Auriculariales sp. MPI-PUGE-AT-0066]|nr:lipase [Auriculariales sp. MPI-PUGE-AT-0066]